MLLAVSLPFVMWSQRGLETPFYVFALLWAVLWLCDAAWRPWWPLAGFVLILARPESPLFAFALAPFLAVGRREWRRAIRPLAILLAFSVVMILIRFVYFHDLLCSPFYPCWRREEPPSVRWRSLLEARQAVRKLDPAKLVTRPDMTNRRKPLGVIEAAGGHVNRSPITRLPVGQRCATVSAEGSGDRRRRVEINRLAHGEREIL